MTANMTHTSTKTQTTGHSRRRHPARTAGLAAAVLGFGTALSVLVPALASAATTSATVTKGAVNCAAAPSSCGYPDATTTGVPAGTTLKTVPTQVSSGPGWSYNSGGWVQVTGNGANLTGLYIPYNVNVAASNVTLNDDEITSSGSTSYGVTLRHIANVTVENSTISGLNASSGRLMVGVKDIYGDSTGLQVLNNNISYSSTGVQVEQGMVQGNYIHDMGYLPGDHINGVTSNGGQTGLLTVSGNTILCNHNQTDAVSLFEDFGVQTNRVITNNLLAGGSYTIYGGQNVGGVTTSNITITNNRVSTMYYTNGGVYGPVTGFNAKGAGDTFAGNSWDGTGLAVTAP
jgi:hypothetical protein